MDENWFPHHLKLSERKALYGRLLFWRALESHLLDLLKAGFGSTVELLDSIVRSWTNQEMSTPLNETRLDSFVVNLTKKIEGLVDEDARRVFEPMLNALRSAAKRLSCEACSHLTTVCDGSEKDDEIVSRDGACIAPLTELFVLASKAALDSYSLHSSLFPSDPEKRPELILTTVGYNRKPNDAPAQLYVGGSTEPDRIAGRRISQVKVGYQIKKLDWASYSATLYTLFHECVAHGFESIYPDPNIRITASPDDPFAEGWMDWIAFELMKECLDSSTRLEHGDQYLTCGNELHVARGDVWNTRRASNAVWVGYGRESARRLYGFLCEVSESQTEAWQTFLRLSFDLNLHQSFADERRQMPIRVYDLLGSPQQRRPFENLVDSYLENGDALEFVAGAKALHGSS